MKHVLLGLVGVGIAVAVAFVVLRDEVISPGGLLASPSATPTTNITVTSPKPGDKVTGRITVTGLARTFEQNVQWRLSDTTGKQLSFGFTTASAPDIGQFGPYTAQITVPANSPKQLVIEVFESSAKDGSEINVVKVPVTLQ